MQAPLVLDFGAGLLAVRAEPLGHGGWLRVFRLAQPQAPWAHAGVDADAHPDGLQALGDAPDCGEEALRLIFSDHASLSVVLERLQRLSRSFLWKCSACGTALGAAGRRCAPCAAADSERCAEPGSAAWMRAARRRFVAGLDDALPTPAERVEIAEAAAKYWKSSAETWRCKVDACRAKVDASRAKVDELLLEQERRFDCRAPESGPVCGGCTNCLLRALEVATRERDEAQKLAALRYEEAQRRFDCNAPERCGACTTCVLRAMEVLTRECDEACAALQEALADPPEGPDLRLDLWARPVGRVVRSYALKTFPTSEERSALRDQLRCAVQEVEADLDAMDRGEWRQVFLREGDTPPARLVHCTFDPPGSGEEPKETP